MCEHMEWPITRTIKELKNAVSWEERWFLQEPRGITSQRTAFFSHRLENLKFHVLRSYCKRIAESSSSMKTGLCFMHT
jgi:hypothetical protein